MTLSRLGAVSVALLALTYAALFRHAAAPRPDDRVRVVEGAARGTSPPPAATSAPVPPGHAAVRPVLTIGAPPRDRAALAELLAGQSRDPSWAPGAEAELRSRLSAGSSATCAAFLCRVETAPPDRSGARSPDEQAAAITHGWPARLSYNRATATIITDGAASRLLFYVTRAREEEDAAVAG